jgi:hypothetical protein
VSTFVAIYLIGLGVVWIGTACAVSHEPTTHGQDALSFMGCALGVLWPLFIAYLVIASPWLAITWWQTRDERR